MPAELVAELLLIALCLVFAFLLYHIVMSLLEQVEESLDAFCRTVLQWQRSGSTYTRGAPTAGEGSAYS